MAFDGCWRQLLGVTGGFSRRAGDAEVMWTYHAAVDHPTKSHEGHEHLSHELGKGLVDVGSVPAPSIWC